MEKEKETKFKLGDMVININSNSFGHEYGIMQVHEIEPMGDIWCINNIIRQDYSTYGICQTPSKLTIATDLLLSLI